MRYKGIRHEGVRYRDYRPDRVNTYRCVDGAEKIWAGPQNTSTYNINTIYNNVMVHNAWTSHQGMTGTWHVAVWTGRGRAALRLTGGDTGVHGEVRCGARSGR